MEVVQRYCKYCKLPLDPYSTIAYHDQCQKLIQKYNSKPFLKLKKNLLINREDSSKIKWLQYRNKIYEIILAMGGFQILFIITVVILLNLRI